MKADRKRLKAEKVELLGQMKQLYHTLEDKEGELRDFIRNYEQRMKDSEDTIKQVCDWPRLLTPLLPPFYTCCYFS